MKLGDVPPVLELELAGNRAIAVSATYAQTRTAVYTRQQLDASSFVPPPALTPVTETQLEVRLLVLGDPNPVLKLLADHGVRVDFSDTLEGLR